MKKFIIFLFVIHLYPSNPIPFHHVQSSPRLLITFHLNTPANTPTLHRLLVQIVTIGYWPLTIQLVLHIYIPWLLTDGPGISAILPCVPHWPVTDHRCALCSIPTDHQAENWPSGQWSVVNRHRNVLNIHSMPLRLLGRVNASTDAAWPRTKWTRVHSTETLHTCPAGYTPVVNWPLH